MKPKSVFPNIVFGHFRLIFPIKTSARLAVVHHSSLSRQQNIIIQYEGKKEYFLTYCEWPPHSNNPIIIGSRCHRSDVVRRRQRPGLPSKEGRLPG